MRGTVLALLLLLPSPAAAGGPSLTAQRQAAQAAVARAALQALRRCGPGNMDAKTEEVLFPQGAANDVYLVTGGQYALFRVAAGRAALVWCAVPASAGGRPLARAGANTFARYMAANLGLTQDVQVSGQRGRLPADRRPLDLFSVLGGQAGRAVVDPSGAQRCFQVVRREMGLSAPVVTDPARCS